MNSTTEMVSYDYSAPSTRFDSICGFSQFPDGSKFKYNEDGEVCLSTDCSTWAKKLLHNLPLPDYIDSDQFIPPSEILSFPEFGSQERRRKVKKESVGNYIEDCEFCGEYMEKTFSFKRKLICEDCNTFLQKEKCLLCKHNQNQFSINFVTTREIQIRSCYDEYCSTCWGNLTQLTNSYFSMRPEFRDEEEDLEACPGCGSNTGGSLCYWCRLEM